MVRSLVNLFLLLALFLLPAISEANYLLLSSIPLTVLCLMNARLNELTNFWALALLTLLFLFTISNSLMDGGSIFFYNFFLFYGLRPTIVMRKKHIISLSALILLVLLIYTELNVNEFNGRSIGLMGGTYTSLLALMSVIISPKGNWRFVFYILCFYILSLTAVRGVFIVMLVYLILDVDWRRFGLSITVIIGYLIFSDSDLFNRLNMADSSIDSVTSGRSISWIYSLKELTKMDGIDLIKGYGSDFYRDAISMGRIADYPHMDFLYFFMTRGLIGLLSYLYILFHSSGILWTKKKSVFLLNSLHTNFFLFSPVLVFLFINEGRYDDSNSKWRWSPKRIVRNSNPTEFEGE
jgi:hypothetical protein